MVSLFSIVLLPSEVHFTLFLFKFLWARDGLDVKGAACSWGESNSHSQELKHRFLSKPGRDAAEQRHMFPSSLSPVLGRLALRAHDADFPPLRSSHSMGRGAGGEPDKTDRLPAALEKCSEDKRGSCDSSAWKGRSGQGAGMSPLGYLN